MSGYPPLRIPWALAAMLAIAVTCDSEPAKAQTDPSGEWRTWRTTHFRVHAHAALADAALEAAAEAERAYGLLAAELEPPRGTIDLVVGDNVDYSNGWATVFPSNRLTVYLAPPTGSPSLGNYDGWLRLVVIHELTHLFHLDRTAGVWKVLQSVFGRSPGLFPNVYQPSWVAEGLATYYESRFSEAGRARGAYHRSLLSAAAADARWPSQGDVWLTSSTWPSGHLPYAWGTEFFTAAADAFGDSLVPRLVERTSSQLWPFAVSRPLRLAGGEGVADGWQRLRGQAQADVGSEPEGRRVLERGLRVLPSPRISPDGLRIAYVRNDGKRDAHVVVRVLESWLEVGTHRINGSADLAWVGDTLYVAQLEFTSPVEIVSDLFRWHPGAEWQRVTSGARLAHPFATTDGDPAAVDVGTRARSLVRVVNGVTEGIAAPAGEAYGRVAAAPGSPMYAGARHRDGRWDIVLWRADSAQVERAVTDDASRDADPAWTNDGVLVFSSERGGASQIYAYRPADSSTVQMTWEPTGAMEPAPGPSASLYYTTVLGDGYALVSLPSQPPAREAPPGTPAVAFVEAERPAVQAGGFDPWPALRPRYWVPFWRDEGNTGFFASALTTGEDPIGRTFYLGAVGVSFDPSRWEALVGVVHTRWKHVQLDASLSQQWDGLVGVTETGEPIAIGERERAADVGLTWRWQRLRSSVDIRVGTGVERSDFFDESTGGSWVGASPTLAVGTISAQAAYLSRPALSISPENGIVARGFVKRRWGISDSRWSYQLQGMLRGYLALPLPGFSHWVLAGAVTAGRTGGPWAERLELGGESGDLLETIPGLAFGSGRRAFSLRGYPRGGAFTRAFTATLEARVPVAMIGRGWRRLPVFLDRVSLTGFAEVGGGWVEGGEPDPASLRNVGGELVLDIGLIRDYPLRVRAGGAVPLTDGLGVSRGDVRWYLALGSAF